MADCFYRAFEDRHRGSRELVKSRLRVYEPFLELLKTVYGHGRAIDLGCGRGEWLEILGELGFLACGVDLDAGMLDACKTLDLPAEQGEAIAFLRVISDDSVAVVSGFHVAEHIAFADLQILVKEALRVLKPAGILILETPNPENLAVGTSGFYCDPTHTRPLPPALLSFLPEHYGFARVKILRLQEPAELLTVATGVGLVDVLQGVSPDYAVVAQKAAESPDQAELFDALFAHEYGIDLRTLATRYDQGITASFQELRSLMNRFSEIQQHMAQVQLDLSGAQQEILRMQAEFVRMHQRLARTQLERDQAQQRIAEIQAERDQAHHHSAQTRLECDRVQQQLAETQLQHELAQQQVAALLASASWRVTGPLRHFSLGARFIGKQLARGATVLGRLAKAAVGPAIERMLRSVMANPRATALAQLYLRRFPKFKGWLRRIAVARGIVADLAELGPTGIRDLVPKSHRIMEAAESRLVALDADDINVAYIDGQGAE
jgi:SAM-dependent methyltransferase